MDSVWDLLQNNMGGAKQAGGVHMKQDFPGTVSTWKCH